MSQENSGGFVNYYLVPVNHPQRTEQVPYQAECEDIIDALELTPDEANIFKEIWRSARQRQGTGKKGNTPLRAAQKYVHYSNRILRKAERESGEVNIVVSGFALDAPHPGDPNCKWEPVDRSQGKSILPSGLCNGERVDIYTLGGITTKGARVSDLKWDANLGAATITHIRRI